MTSRVRCSCGRIYDPVKHTTCPDCGSESAVESIVVAEKVKPPAPPDLAAETPKHTSAAERPAPDYWQLLQLLPWPVYAGVAALLLVLLVLVFHHRAAPTVKQAAADTTRNASPAEQKSSPATSPHASASEIPSGGAIAPVVTPTASVGPATIPGGGSMPAFGMGNLTDLIAKAGPNGTVKLPPGVYQGGAIINQPVKIIGENAAQVFIQSDTRDALAVHSKGVLLQNVQIMFSGSGEVPAVSVSDNAELQTDGAKISSSSNYGVVVSANASIQAGASTFSASSGTAVQVDRQSRANFTKCTFTDAQDGVSVANGSVAELHACAFDRNGARTGRGAIMTISGEKTKVTMEDCRFTSNPSGIGIAEGASAAILNSNFKDNGVSSVQGNSTTGLIQVRNGGTVKLDGDTFENNGQGVVATSGGIVELDKCRFEGTGLQTRGELIASCAAICSNGQGSTVTVRNCFVSGSASYSVAVMWSGRLNMEDTEVSGAKTVGLLIGDRNGLPAVAEVKHCKFVRNTTGIGVCAGSSANIVDSESRENSEGVLALDRGTKLVLTKATLIGNREHGLCVYGGGEVQASDSQIENNGRGAQSGMQRKSSASGGSLTLQNSRVAGNQIFGVGAYAKNQLTLTGVTFEGNGKTNIYKENGAIVRTDGAADPGQAQAANADDNADNDHAGADDQATPSKRPHKPKRQQANDDDARRIIRRFFPRP